jgi:hypothetical protein
VGENKKKDNIIEKVEISNIHTTKLQNILIWQHQLFFLLYHTDLTVLTYMLKWSSIPYSPQNYFLLKSCAFG